MKYFLFSFFFFVLIIVNIGFNMPIVHADDFVNINNQKNESPQNTQFIPLVGIPYVDTNEQNMSLSGYVNALYIASMSIAAFMAVVKIIFAGVKYMLSDVITTKESAKKDIKGALLGLLIVIGAVLILNTINPELSKLTFLGGPPIDLQTKEHGYLNIIPGDSIIIGYGKEVNESEWMNSCKRNGGNVMREVYSEYGSYIGIKLQCTIVTTSDIEDRILDEKEQDLINNGEFSEIMNIPDFTMSHLNSLPLSERELYKEEWADACEINTDGTETGFQFKSITDSQSGSLRFICVRP